MDGKRLSSRGGGLTDAGSAVWDASLRIYSIGGRLRLHDRRLGRRAAEPCTDPTNARIHLLERLNDRTVSIAWRDATPCHYAEQVWTRCVARATKVRAGASKSVRSTEARRKKWTPTFRKIEEWRHT
ncbi:DUF3331 domain-containing protein [Caballeronia sp. S22]|uniref:DUF3331 domain-containing protein n=1 Tax=Caballeronia sp. S22 TaxID=3137182 RepID=UPI003530D90D